MYEDLKTITEDMAERPFLVTVHDCGTGLYFTQYKIGL